jgi:heat shock protein HslJ
MRAIVSVLIFAAAVAACKQKPDTPPAADSATGSDTSPSPSGITEREWVLVQLGDNMSPQGNGGKPVTLTLASAERRASGNAGCNRYSGPFTLSGTQLTFGPAISTKMACEQGMDVETAFLSMLDDVRTYQARDSSLTLLSGSEPVARFR